MSPRSLVVATVFLCLSFWASYSLDSFSTMLLSLPGLLFFLVSSLFMIQKSIDQKSLQELKGLVVVAIGFALLVLSIRLSDHGLAELTKEREAAMAGLRPILLKYRDDQGAFPETLEALVPRYLAQVPHVLTPSSEQGDSYKQISYTVRDGKANFSYCIVRGPDSRASYDVATGAIHGDR